MKSDVSPVVAVVIILIVIAVVGGFAWRWMQAQNPTFSKSDVRGSGDRGRMSMPVGAPAGR